MCMLAAKLLLNFGIGHVGSNNINKTQSTLRCFCLWKTGSIWSSIEKSPPDPIYGLVERYSKDTDPNKHELAIGVYHDDDGNSLILPSVRAAETKLIAMNMNKDYNPLAGLEQFTDLTIRNALGAKSKHVKAGFYAAVQTLSGTGALRVCAEFLKTHFPEKVLFLPNITWTNHRHIFEHTGVPTDNYYYSKHMDPDLNISEILKSLQSLPDQSAVLFQASAHNPSGIDLTPEHWKEICEVVVRKEMLVVFDMLMQGFATGDLAQDAYAVRLFAKKTNNIIICHCYSKNMGLYGDRCGALSVLTESKETAENVKSQLKTIIRALWSSPPLHGSRIVITILNDKALTKQWERDVKGMFDRIITMRALLKKELQLAGSVQSWDHITKQTGMFCNTGLTREQTALLINNHHIYMTSCGRMSMPNVNPKNVRTIASAIHAVTK